MVTILILYTEYFKCLGCFTFTSNNRCEADLYKQVRMLYCRSNCLVELYIYLISAVKQYCLTLYDPGGALKAPPPPPIFCPHAFNFGATLLCVGAFPKK